MGKLNKIQDIDQFCKVGNVRENAITSELRESVRQLDERRILEPLLREVLYDPTGTAHGATEIADILTSTIRVQGIPHLAAFVVKGRSFTKVRSKDIAHQVIRLGSLPDLAVMALATVGYIQDSARQDFTQVTKDADCDYFIIDAVDLASLLLTYGKICPSDGTLWYSEGVCQQGHEQDKGITLKVRTRDSMYYHIARLQDVSFGGIRRLSFTVFVSLYLNREALRKIIYKATQEVLQSSYYRNEMVSGRCHTSHVYVVWLDLR